MAETLAAGSRIVEWQSHQTSIGARYSIGYLALDTGAITSLTISQFRFVLENRVGVKVDSVTLLGRVMQANITVDRSDTLMRLLQPFIVAGDPAITFQVMTVTTLVPLSSAAATISGTLTTPFQIGKEIGDKISSTISDAIGSLWGAVPSVGETAGKTVGAAIKPLIVPAVLFLVGFYLVSRTTGRL